MKKQILIVIMMFIFLIMGVLTMFHYKQRHNAYITNDTECRSDIICDMNTLVVQRREKGYAIVFRETNGEICYDEDGLMTYCVGIQPLNADAVLPSELVKIKSVHDMITMLGEPMVDIGSGVYLPTYITDRGQILTFSLCSEQILKYVITAITDI